MRSSSISKGCPRRNRTSSGPGNGSSPWLITPPARSSRLVVVSLHNRSPALAGDTMAKKVATKKVTKSKAPKAKTAPAQAKTATTTLEEALRQLESLGSEDMRAYNAKSSHF